MSIETASARIPEWSLGDRLRKVRVDSGYDQREFAELVGLTSSSLAAYETGRSSPRFKDVQPLAQRIEEVTGVPAWWVIGGDWSPLSDSNRRPPLYKSGALAN
jgi:transcriptional regulator with XRE-family HTH domain